MFRNLIYGNPSSTPPIEIPTPLGCGFGNVRLSPEAETFLLRRSARSLFNRHRKRFGSSTKHMERKSACFT